MSRARARLLVLAAVVLCLALPLAGCGGDGASTPAAATTATPRDDSAEVMAAAVKRLITRDHTFGEGAHRFAEYLIQDHIDPAAGAPDTPATEAGRPLTAGERAAIAGVVAPFGPYRFIADADAWRTRDLRPTVPGAVILGVGEPVIDDDTALAPVSLWCSGLCGTWLSYRVARVGGVWKVTGTEGPVAIS